MKGIYFAALSMIILCTAISAQKSVDNLFEKYSGKDGFSSITLKGPLLKLAGKLDDDDVSASINEIRILSQNDKSIDGENFYKYCKRNLDFNGYDEYMNIKEADNDMIIYLKNDGATIKEFLLIAGGNENTIIQVKGKMTLHDVRKLAANVRHGHCGINSEDI